MTLPRAAMHCPLIWHAAVALGSAHESQVLRTRGPGNPQAKLDWTLEQYGRAIRCFMAGDGPGKKASTEVAIIASIMFTVFEVLSP